MADPIGLVGMGSSPVSPGRGAGPMDGGGAAGGAGGASFRDMLMDNIEQVNRLQQEASAAIEDLQTGKRDDLEGVLLATQRADTAFKMLLAVRNKVAQAYEEVKQMRV